MTALFEQLPLAVQLRDEATFENFYVADNALLVEQLRQQLLGGERYIYLFGQQGSGRSHLLQASCHLAESLNQQALYLPLKDLQDYPPEALFESVEQLDLVCLDDLDRVIGQADWEAALFHLFNRLKDSGTALVISAETSVRELPVQLADLASRLSWGSIFQLANLDDDQRQQAFKFRANIRGMEIPDEAMIYLYNRCSRDMDSLFIVLDQLDKASLKQQRKITSPFIKTVI